MTSKLQLNIARYNSFFYLHIFILIVSFLCLSAGISAQTWEFSGTSYSYQKAHFDSATNLVKSKLGIQMHTFGAPYNQIDANFISVMTTDTNYKVLLFGQLNPTGTGQVNLTNRVFIESATGVPDYNYFLTSYNSKKNIYTDYMVMQGHAYAWTTPAKQTEFRNIINFLISEGVEFMTPFGYYKNPSGSKPGKVKVLLKIDDLRATTSYFTPCFPAYDYLISVGVSAGFGINNIKNMSQTQIDTLNYYLRQKDSNGNALFEIWNHGLDHSMTPASSGGNWSDTTTWGGAVPTSADDIVIETGTTVTIDVNNSSCQNLTVNGTLVTSITSSTSLIVNGDLVINTGGSFTTPAHTSNGTNLFHTLTVFGDYSNTGGTFDFRLGSAGTTMSVMNTTFAGNLNSVITVGAFSSSNNDFNGIIINKTDGAKVICGSDVFLDQGASTCVSQLTMTSGMIETGIYSINVLSTASADLVSPSATSYINGALGRGMSTSAGKSCLFQIGDANGYRPITVKSTTGGLATGHYCQVRCIPGDANAGGSIFTNGIDKVSGIRYYSVSYNKGVSGAASMSFGLFSPSYGKDDGVIAGNTDLRVAYSTNNRATWYGMGQTKTHTISLTSPPTTITPDSLTLGNYLTLNSGTGNIYVCLANKSGGLNPLPVELSLFASYVNGRDIILNWETATEKNSDKFVIERTLCCANTANLNWEIVASIKAAVLSNSPKQYSFTDKKLQSGKFQYRLKMIDNDGSYLYSKTIETEIALPLSFGLSQNYPNPFNPSTKINYNLPFESKVTLDIYSINGERIEQLVNGEQPAGYYSLDFRPSSLEMASGIYIYRINAIEKGTGKIISLSKKMTLLK